MRISDLITCRTLTALLLFAAGLPAYAQSEVSACPRPLAGSEAQNPPSLYSHNGELVVNLAYRTSTDSDGRTLYCFTTPEGLQNPTLHVLPGDKLVVNLTNTLPETEQMQMDITSGKVCGAPTMNANSVNLHYHGLNLPPHCHQDEVIQTTVNSGQTFQYRMVFPRDEPPGLYWYHPHIHGIAEAAVLGGASGAIVVDGIEKFQQEVRNLQERILLIRDQNVAGAPAPGGKVPSWDLTLNAVPIAYPELIPALIRMPVESQELWRVANATADSLVDVQLLFDGIPQMLRVVAFDGVPVGSQDGTMKGKIIDAEHVLVPTAGRAEFIVSAPPAEVKSAVFITKAVKTGPDGDNDTRRVLAKVQLGRSIPSSTDSLRLADGLPIGQRFEWLAAAAPAAIHRDLYFSEILSDPDDPASPTNFYITVNGAQPQMFSPSNGPAISTTQGSVEEWTIENRSMENHEFHIHQIHFQVLSQNNFEINGSKRVPNIFGQFLDTIQVPYWDGNPQHPYPNVKLRMDFRGPDIGDFVYHCHILGHEDNGMMAIIRVEPAAGKAVVNAKAP